MILKVALLTLTPLLAQANMGDVFADLMGRPDRGGIKASYEVKQFESAPVGDHMLGLRHHTAQVNAPLSSLSDRKWKLMLNGGLEEIHTNARFPGGRPLPNQVWNAGAGISHVRLTDQDHTVGGFFQVGSHGDRPFGAFRDISIEATAFYKLPQENEAAWVFFLSFANDRGFLNYVPLPGAGYFFRPHEKLRLAIGLPFVMAFWSPFDKAVASFTYFPVNRGQFKFSYFLFGPAHFYLGARYQSENSFPSDRRARKERFFYEEAVTDLGFSMPLERHLLADLSVGYSFDRKYFLGEGQTDWKDNGLIVRAKSAPFASLRLTASF